MRVTSDLRDSARALRNRPGFSLAVILTLALAIGANTAIFSAVDALILKALPFADPERLVRLQSERGGEPGSLSYREIQDLRELRDVFVDIAAYTDQGQYNASGFGRPEELVSTITTANLFSVLGRYPQIGAPWPEILDRTRDFKVVISHGFWQRRFAGAPDVVGKTMTLDGAEGYEIVGVAPRGFAFPLRADLYRSHGIAAAPIAYEDRSRRGRWGVGRLRDGVSLEQAQERINALARRLERDFPSTNEGIAFRVSPLRAMYIGEAGPVLWLLLGAVGLVLAIACGNVANLMLSRALAREREIAVRKAIGATRGDIARTLLSESVVLGAIAFVLGIGIALAGVEIIAGLVRLDTPLWTSIEISWRVLIFGAVTSIAAAIVASLVPAWRASKADVATALKDGGRGGSEGRQRQRARAILVVGQTAFAVVLLVGAGLLVRSFTAITRVDPGFNADSVLTFRVELGWAAYGGLTKTVQFQRELTRQLQELPGVRSVGMVDNLPMDGRPTSDEAILAEGQSTDEERANPFVNLRYASPGFFETLRLPLVAGRYFTEDDRDSTQLVTIVSRNLARRFWPDGDAVGRRLQLRDYARAIAARDSTADRWLTIVGVVGDIRHDGPTSAATMDAYIPFYQWQQGSIYYLVRTSGDPMALARRAPELVYGIDPNQSYFDVRTMRERVRDRTWVPRMGGALFAAFGALATVLAMIGLYAMLAFAIAQRRHELSVRQALGATPSLLARLVMREGMRLALLGGAIGIALAFISATGVRRLLFGVTPADGFTYVLVAALLLLASAAACLIPARRVMRIQAIEAMKST